MIFTERTIKIKNGSAVINLPIVLYRGDKNIEVIFKITNNKFKFSPEKANFITESSAKFGQLAIETPDGSEIFSDISECVDGKVIFVITGEMIDELHEVGFYSFHIRLFNDDQTSRVTIPPIINGIEIRVPIVDEDE